MRKNALTRYLPPRGIGNATPDSADTYDPGKPLIAAIADALIGRSIEDPGAAVAALGETLYEPVAAFRRNALRDRLGQPMDVGDLTTSAAAMLPGSVVRSGRGQVDDIARALAGSSSRTRLAHRHSAGYNPLPVKERPFDADYPRASRSDGDGRLSESIEGDPLVAEFVAGRRRVGQGDEGLSPDETFSAVERLVSETRPGTRAELKGGLGAYRVSPSRIVYDETLEPALQSRVVAHEFGHALDEMAGQIDTKGLSKELGVVYSDLATGQQGRTRHLTGPKHFGYSPEEEPRELMAEAIRAYMANPNYLKTTAPKTAEAIRRAINRHPKISKVVQFNVGGGDIAAAIAAALQPKE